MPEDGVELVRRRLAESIAVTQRMLEEGCLEAAADVADRVTAALRSGGKVLFFGNGGSSMDAGHLACELLGRFLRDRPSLAAISLPDSTAAMTAIGNDYGYDDVFARQLRGLGRPGDVAFALTTSGNSTNVLRGLEAAKEAGLVTVVLTGANGGKAAEIADLCVRVPTDETPRIQEACMHLGHTICEIVEQRLFPAPPDGYRPQFREDRP